MTRFYERQDWAQRLRTPAEPLLLERGTTGESDTPITPVPDEPETSTLERAMQARLAHKGMSTAVKLTPLNTMRARLKPTQPEITP